MSARQGGGLQRAWHRDRCGRWCAAAPVRPADLQGRRQRHHLRRPLEHELTRAKERFPCLAISLAARQGNLKSQLLPTLTCRASVVEVDCLGDDLVAKTVSSICSSGALRADICLSAVLGAHSSAHKLTLD